jgi:eukaryotic-like serine/threonine-protein kinase
MGSTWRSTATMDRWTCNSVAINGSTGEEPQLVGGLTRAAERVPLSYSPDGHLLLFRISGRFPLPTSGTQQSSVVARNEVWALPLTGERKPFPFLTELLRPGDARFSPDGRWVAFSAAEDASQEISIASFPKSGTRVRVSANGGSWPRWSRDGRELFFIWQNGIWSARIRLTDNDVDVGAVTRLFGVRVSGPQSNYAVTPDRQRFLVNLLSDVAPESHNPIIVVLNWTSGLK